MSGRYIGVSWTRDRIMVQLMASKYVFDESIGYAIDLPDTVGDPIEVAGARIADGWAQCDTLKFSQVRGPEVGGIVLFRDSDGKLIVFHDSIEAFPMIPNGGDIEIEILEPGIFRI